MKKDGERKDCNAEVQRAQRGAKVGEVNGKKVHPATQTRSRHMPAPEDPVFAIQGGSEASPTEPKERQNRRPWNHSGMGACVITAIHPLLHTMEGLYSGGDPGPVRFEPAPIQTQSSPFAEPRRSVVTTQESPL